LIAVAARMRGDDRQQSRSVLAFLAVAAAAAGWVAWRVAAPALGGWYGEIVKPAIAPPGAVFAPAWAALYLLMALGAWSVFRSDAEPAAKARAFRAFWIQLALSFAWIVILFGARDPGWAFVEILILLAAVVIALLRFAKIDRLAGLLLLPQLAWTAYMTLLNFLVWQMNLKP
jgi:translocator protein